MNYFFFFQVKYAVLQTRVRLAKQSAHSLKLNFNFISTHVFRPSNGFLDHVCCKNSLARSVFETH